MGGAKSKSENKAGSATFQGILVRLALLPVMVLDLIVFILSFRWLRLLLFPRADQRIQSVAVGEATNSHGAPRRSALYSEKLIKGDYGTIFEMTQAAVKEYGDKTAMVSRKFLELRKVSEKDRYPRKFFDKKLRETTFSQFGQNLRDFGFGLRKLGMEKIPALKEGQTLDDLEGPFVMVIFEDTCEQWTTALQGAFSQSITVATCYATLGEDAVVAAVNETQATTLFLNWKKAEEFSKIADKMPSLTTIIASTHEMPENASAPKSASGGVAIVLSDEVIKLGRENPIGEVPPKPTDVAVIMYTSGSTGYVQESMVSNATCRPVLYCSPLTFVAVLFSSSFTSSKPKGVVMRHSQLVAGVSGMAMNLDIRRGAEVFVSYLPLAHILALQVENGMIYYGGKICYSDPRELSKALALFKPTVFAGVPKVWSLLQAGMYLFDYKQG